MDTESDKHPVDEFGHPYHQVGIGRRIWYSTTMHGIICAICGEEFSDEDISRES